MNEKAKELFLQNYANEGDCKDLQNHEQKINFKRKAGQEQVIKYLPWAVVERLFRLQGGKAETLDICLAKEIPTNTINPVTGEMLDKKYAYFTHLKGTWQGEELEEYYPLFNTADSKVIPNPDATHINKAIQRGKVRLIARLSGIGLYLFDKQIDDETGGEDADLLDEKVEIEAKPQNFDTSSEKPNQKNPKGKLNEKTVSKQDQEKEKVKDAFAELLGVELEKPTPTKKASEDEISNLLKGGVVETKKQEQESIFEFDTKDTEKVAEDAPVVLDEKPTQNNEELHQTLLSKVKTFVPTHRELILKFREEKNKQVLSALTVEELKELLALLGVGV